jgi:hypothetical protein
VLRLFIHQSENTQPTDKKHPAKYTMEDIVFELFTFSADIDFLTSCAFDSK